MSHPIRRSEVQDEVERFTRTMLAETAGTGRILVEFDFKEWRVISWDRWGRGARRTLTTNGESVGSSKT
jgi:hypothetical protein